MAINSTQSRIQYTASGGTTAFPFPYLFYDNTHLVVLGVDANGVTTTYALGPDYTITGAGQPTGGTVTFLVAPIAGTAITIYRNVPFVQSSDYVNDDALPAEVLESDLDKSAMRDQQLNDALSRALKYPVTEPLATVVTLPTVAARAGKVLGFSSVDGSPIPMITDSANVVLAQAAANAAAASAVSAAASVATIKPFDDNQYAVATGTNTYVAALTPTLSAYVTGMELAIKIVNANTGAATLNVDGLGAISIRNNSALLTAGELLGLQVALLRYDGTYFQLLNPASTPGPAFAFGSVSTAQSADVSAWRKARTATAVLTGNVAFTFSNPTEGQAIVLLAAASGGARTLSFSSNSTYKIQNSEVLATTGFSIPSGETWLFGLLSIGGTWYVNVGKKYG